MVVGAVLYNIMENSVHPFISRLMYTEHGWISKELKRWRTMDTRPIEGWLDIQHQVAHAWNSDIDKAKDVIHISLRSGKQE
jgi:hypothetical protein